jgi:hypothetical protein
MPRLSLNDLPENRQRGKAERALQELAANKRSRTARSLI